MTVNELNNEITAIFSKFFNTVEGSEQPMRQAKTVAAMTMVTLELTDMMVEGKLTGTNSQRLSDLTSNVAQYIITSGAHCLVDKLPEGLGFDTEVKVKVDRAFDDLSMSGALQVPKFASIN